MHPLAHRYSVSARCTDQGLVPVRSEGLPELQTSAPPEFDGPPGHWSPETLLSAAVADCFALTFRAVARASRLAWRDLEVDVQATLDRTDGVTRFTHFEIRAALEVEDAASQALAEASLAKSKRACLVTQSLLAPCELEAVVRVAPPA